MVDNFDIISNLLHFDSDDDFYYLQIMKRRKENPDMDMNNKVILQYIVDYKDFLLNNKERIVELCKENNARAYINLNRRSLERATLEMLRVTSERIISKSFKGVQNDFYSAVERIGTNYKKMWIVDIDTKDEKYIKNIINVIDDIAPISWESPTKVIAEIPTANGVHLITTPFNTKEFDNLVGEDKPEIHKNNPTLLYYGN